MKTYIAHFSWVCRSDIAEKGEELFEHRMLACVAVAKDVQVAMGRMWDILVDNLEGDKSQRLLSPGDIVYMDDLCEVTGAKAMSSPIYFASNFEPKGFAGGITGIMGVDRLEHFATTGEDDDVKKFAVVSADGTLKSPEDEKEECEVMANSE